MSAMRRPKGYVGVRHEASGVDLQSFIQSLTLPEQILGDALFRRLASAEAAGWYPVEWLLEAMDQLERRAGTYSLMQMGRQLFKKAHEPRVKQSLSTASDLLFGMDRMYRYVNRGGQIGGWKVLEFQPGLARLEKTTPHHCVAEEGFLSEALRSINVPSLVRQTQCFRKGGESCIYLVTSIVTDKQWMGARTPVVAPGAGA